MLTEVETTQYAIRVNGQVVGTYQTRMMAEAALLLMPASARPLAEVVPVQGGTGKQVLFG